uniref:Si:ch211-252f13.5 n=1 Tax=Tetraodon nigroviridis TaxID=99883 RepID=H3CR24_TETNG
MASVCILFLLWATCMLSEEAVSETCRGTRCFPDPDWIGPCVGAHCQGLRDAASSRTFPNSAQPRPVRVYPSFQQDARFSPYQGQSAPLAPYAVVQAQQAVPDARRTNPKTLTADVAHPCAGGTCPPADGDDTAARGCKGVGCKLPGRMRHKPKPCVGNGCGAHAEELGRGGAAPVHVRDTAAQFLSEFGSETGAWIQLTCDMKAGANDVPSEDALVLQLQLSEDQKDLVEALKSQQEEVRELQRLLGEQQGTLLLQQREILEQQRSMFEQLEDVKSHYNLMMETIKQTSFQNIQGDLGGHVETPSVRDGAGNAQQALALHKVDMEASVMEDRDECLEIPGLCRDQQKCLNTPGGFRCPGMTEHDAFSGLCGHGYFFNAAVDECQACNDCDGEPAASPCTANADTVCSGAAASAAPEAALSLSWAGDVSLPGAEGHTLAHFSHGAQLHVSGRSDSALVAVEKGRLVLRQHGLVWLDENLSVHHGCRSFIQACLRLNSTHGSEGRHLSGVRVEQQDARSFQSASISGVAEVAPGDLISLSVRSASQHCNDSSEGVQLFHHSAASLSLLWLSHDTGAVAMTAQAAVSAHYHTNHRLAFRTTYTSDPYVVGLTHDGRGIRFAESGAVRFVFQQALYSMGHACVSEGFQVLAYLNHNGTGSELCRSFRPGVHYRDTSLSLSGAATVAPGDTLLLEILSPPQCNVRFFGDETGISALSLVWVPAALSSSLSASVSNASLPSGAVRNKPLFFRQTTAGVAQMDLQGRGSAGHRRDVVFRESGTASVALDLKLIHSCNLVKVTLLRRGAAEGARPVPLAQQVEGQMPEGSRYARVSLRASFQVHNGTAVFFTLDCVRGRVNQISHQSGSGVSILWVAA